MAKKAKMDVNTKLALFSIVFFLIGILLGMYVLAGRVTTSSEARARSRTRLTCGQHNCRGVGCQGNMRCVPKHGTTSYWCINPGPGCGGSNPCCSAPTSGTTGGTGTTKKSKLNSIGY